ncbi:ArsR/SmtB family transcription factor [Fusibacter bizertensis]
MTSLTDLFKLLSDETRLRILMLLYIEPLCVCELSGVLGTSQPKISKNLSKLRDLKIVVDERREKFVFYSLRLEHPMLNHILSNIAQHIEDYPELLSDSVRLNQKEQFLTLCTLQIDPNESGE